MDGLKPIIIPTRYKAKISHDLSFPVGAEKISKALSDTPQIRELILHFNSDRWHQVAYKRYACIGVMHSSRRAAMADMHLDAAGVPLFSEWEIDVHPVPRICRHRIQRYIVDHALTEMRDWLRKRAEIPLLGEESLKFFFDEERDEFSSEVNEQLHPQRA